MNKNASVGDIISGPVAIVALVLVLILFSFIFFGPAALLRADRDITLNGVYFTDNTKLMNLLKSNSEEGTLIADNIVAAYNQEYSHEKLNKEIEDYLNYLPHPETGSWHLTVYKDETQIMNFGEQNEMPKNLIQSTIIPVYNSEDVLKVELYLVCDCNENQLEDYS